MTIINTLFGIPLGHVMRFCWQLVGNYGVSIILFTLFTKIIMFPLSLISQKNSIAMIKLRPLLEDVRRRYDGNSAEIAEMQKALYKKERYSPIKGMLPLLIQIPIILGLINVIYHPVQHLLQLDADTIGLFIERTARFLNITPEAMGTGAELTVLETAQANPALFTGLSGLDKILQMDLHFLGTNMAEVPRLASATVLYPILSGASALLLGIYQNRVNILQRVQSVVSRWGMTIFLVAFSAFFAAILPCGVGLYWISGNLMSIPVQALCNKIYDPGAYADNLKHIEKPHLTREEKRAQRVLNAKKRRTQRADKKRFMNTKDKQLVFYAESSGYYKYFEGFIDYILEHSELVVHYVTSDINDQVFAKNNPRIQTYYIGPIALIQFMMLMDADMVVMTMPDLEKYQIKRSLVRKDIEYIYLDHGMTSLHLMLREGALDHFDTIFCYGPNHIREIRETERVYDLPPKKLVKTGYPLLDSMLKAADELGNIENDPKKILIAPSWQKDNILELCPDEVIRPLLDAGYRVIARPHPEFVKRFPDQVDALIRQYSDAGDAFEFQTSFASNETVYTADLVITDWSTIANEFSYATKKPSLFINTPMKIMNPNYKKIPCVPLDISLRDEIGISIDTDKLDQLPEVVTDLLERKDYYREHIADVVQQNIFDVGNGAQGGGSYIVNTLTAKRKAREKQAPSKKDRMAPATVASDLRALSEGDAHDVDQDILSMDETHMSTYLEQIEQRLETFLARVSDQQDEDFRKSVERHLRERVTPDPKQTHPRGIWIKALLDDLVDVDIETSSPLENATSAKKTVVSIDTAQDDALVNSSADKDLSCATGATAPASGTISGTAKAAHFNSHDVMKQATVTASTTPSSYTDANDATKRAPEGDFS